MNAALRCAVVCSLMAAVFSYKQGAPVKSCANLRPWHEGTAPQTSPCPYDVTLKNYNLSPGQKTYVKISSEDNLTFKGFIIQCRVVESNDEYGDVYEDYYSGSPSPYPPAPPEEIETTGMFLEGDGYKPLTCFSTNDTVTHSNNAVKTSAKVPFLTSADFVGQCQLTWTIVRDYAHYWVLQTTDEYVNIGKPDRESGRGGRGGRDKYAKK